MLPKVIHINGIRYDIIEDQAYFEHCNRCATYVEDKCKIYVDTSLPFPRQTNLFLNQVARIMLGALGWKIKDINKFDLSLASALQVLFTFNTFSWLIGVGEFPAHGTTIWIGPVTYTIHLDKDQQLRGAGCIGMIPFKTLEIWVRSDLPQTMKDHVLIHEIAHGVLYEANYDGDAVDDAIVAPLGNLLYHFCKDNDLNWLYDPGIHWPGQHIQKTEGDKINE